MKRPVGVGKMRARQTNQIGAPGRDDAIDVVSFVDVADSDGGTSAIVADEVRQRRLKHAPRLGLGG